VFAENFLKKNPGAQVIADVKCCNKVFETVKACGGIGIMERVGHSFIKARMKSSGALLAGEMSGHFFFKDRWFGFDDGLYAALRCIEIMCEQKDILNNLSYGLITPEIRVPCSEDQKFAVTESVKAKLKEKQVPMCETDGVRVTGDGGWWLLRTSNTQNSLSLRIEAYSPQAMQELKEEIAGYLCEYIPDIREKLSNYDAKRVS
jgi:phosphomannomutase